MVVLSGGVDCRDISGVETGFKNLLTPPLIAELCWWQLKW